jgi:hypothetical protein
VEKLEWGCFNDCTELVEVIFEPGSRLREIEGNAFYRCPRLTKLKIPSSVEKLDSSAFTRCESLKKINFKPKKSVIRELTDLSFLESSMKSFNVPDSVEKISCPIHIWPKRQIRLNFGKKSNLRELHVFGDPYDDIYEGMVSRCFIRLSEPSLRRFRLALQKKARHTEGLHDHMLARQMGFSMLDDY